jgi:hypothetical protein
VDILITHHLFLLSENLAVQPVPVAIDNSASVAQRVLRERRFMKNQALRLSEYRASS